MGVNSCSESRLIQRASRFWTTGLGHLSNFALFYEYDFGDCWTHAVSLVVVRRGVGVKYPRCIQGSRSGPPEDVGGPPGYVDFLKAWHDPLDDQHKDMRRWAGRKFDPERFDLDATNKAITRAIRRSRGNYRFRHEA